MSVPLVVGAAVAIVSCVAHIAAGERIFTRIDAKNLPATWLGDGTSTRALLRGISHLFGVSWLAAGVLLLLYADDPIDGPTRDAVRLIAGTFAFYALVTLITRRVVAFRHPGFYSFSAIALAAWLATV